MADVLGSMVVQDLTFTQAHHGLAFKITYLNGGVAGAETIKVEGVELVFKIASGTSTATQIAAALNADQQALKICTVTVTGTGSNVQKTAVAAFLSGGANAITAALPVKYFQLFAKTPGTGGNSIRFHFTSGASSGAANVSVSGNDITCQIQNGITLYSTVRDAIVASSSAAALVGVATAYDLRAFIATSADMSSLTNLAGGVASSKPAVVIQDLTYSSVTAGPTSKRQAITYTIGATAGSEVVSLDTNGSETIQIENGVSTATQIKAAHDGNAPALALRTVAITGTGSNAQTTVNQLATVSGESLDATTAWEYPDVYKVDQIS